MSAAPPELQRPTPEPAAPIERARGSIRVLVIDDEALVQEYIHEALSPLGHEVIRTGHVDHARAVLDRMRVDLVLLDLRLDGTSGLEVIPEILAADASATVVLMTGFGSIDSAVEAMRRGAFDYLTKPIAPADLHDLVERVITRRQGLLAVDPSPPSTAPAPLLSSAHPGMARALAMAYDIAGTDATVLITGETGTGKGVLARAIHQWSRRAEAPYAVVNCPALSPELLRSELFGHVRGAFTGAVSTKVGKIEYAHRGTLFLDEIGELALDLQPRLLCFLQDQTYERVGDPEPRQADVRLIAATNTDLDKAVSQRSFRDDLFHRINVIAIELVPLRERPEDIPRLAESFLKWAAARYQKPVDAFTADALDALQAHAWRGNVRELQHAVERAVILARGSKLPAALLPSAGRNLFDQLGAGTTRHSLPTLKGIEERYIRHVLEHTDSIETAAEVLGVAPSTLWRRRRKFGI